MKETREFKKEIKKGWMAATPRAAPIKGAEHGDATTQAKTPLKKEDRYASMIYNK